YVGGNPETATDPTGHTTCTDGDQPSCYRHVLRYEDRWFTNTYRNKQHRLVTVRTKWHVAVWDDGDVVKVQELERTQTADCDDSCHSLRQQDAQKALKDAGSNLGTVGVALGVLSGALVGSCASSTN